MDATKYHRVELFKKKIFNPTNKQLPWKNKVRKSPFIGGGEGGGGGK